MKGNSLKTWKELYKKPKEYDRVLERFSNEAEIAIAALLKFIDFREKAVLDVGAGTGRFTIPLSKIAKKICAIEPEREMIKSLKEKIREYKIKNIEIKKAIAENIPYPDNSFDIVIYAWILSYINLKKSFKEVKRVLKKDGYLIIIDNYGNDDWEKLAGIQSQKYKGRYDERNKAVLKLLKDFQRIKIKVINGIIKFPNLTAAKEVISKTRGPKAAKYVMENRILKILKKVIFIVAKNKN